MRDRLLRLVKHALAGRMVVAASALACLAIVFSASFALTASSSGSVKVCIGKAHTVDASELYLANGAGFCGPGVKHIQWKKPHGNPPGTLVLCVGDPDGTSNFKRELYTRYH